MVVGRGRSGTTLLRAMLDSHPEVAVPDESPWVVRMAQALPGAYDGAELARRLAADASFLRWQLPADEVARRVRAAPDLAEAVRSLYRLYAEAQGKPRYADKTPSAVMHMERLAALLPETRFVHLIRDGRNVALSYLDAGFDTATMGQAALDWRRFVRRGRASGRALGSARYREVRYEELVADPEAVVRDLCPYLDLAYDPAMLRYFERAEEVVGDMPHPEARRHVYLPPTAGLRDWSTEMSSQQLGVFEVLAGDLLDELGYGRSGQGAGVPARITARWHQVRALATRGARRAVSRRRRSRSGSPARR